MTISRRWRSLRDAADDDETPDEITQIKPDPSIDFHRLFWGIPKPARLVFRLRRTFANDKHLSELSHPMRAHQGLQTVRPGESARLSVQARGARSDGKQASGVLRNILTAAGSAFPVVLAPAL